MTILQSLVSAAAQTSDPKAPSPETLKALGDLLKVLGDHASGKDAGVFSPERMIAVATLISSIAWPLVATVVLIAFKPQIAALAGTITEVKFLGVEAKIQRELKIAAADAEKLAGKSGSPTGDELARAAKIDELATSTELEFIRKQAYELAATYERIRGSQPSGNARTSAMEAVVSQMRSIGRAVSRFRYELAASPSPGRRLQAIASLQVLPDFELIGWLGDRVAEEKPFVAYHALVALNVAARSENARDHLDDFRRTIDALRSTRIPLDTDRMVQIDELDAQIKRWEEGKPA